MIYKTILKTGIRWFWLVLLVVVLDWLSKQWILMNWYLGETYELFSLLNLSYVRNYGAAFSFLSDEEGWQRWFFITAALIVSIGLLFAMFRNCWNQKLINIAYGLIVGGAIGNVLDRIQHGFVVDMVDFHIRDWHYPTFNLADSAICIGVVLILVENFCKAK